MQFLRRQTVPSPTLPIHNGPSRVSSCLDWMATATSVMFTEQDEWKKQYKMVKYSASEHNKSLIEVLKERNGNDFDEISPFMNQHPSNRGEQETQRVEAFCEGFDMVLHGSDTTLIRGHKLANIEEPRAWVSDRNYWLLKDNPTETSRHGNVLGRIDLYNILRKEVCPDFSISTGYPHLTHHSDFVRVQQERWLGPFGKCKSLWILGIVPTNILKDSSVILMEQAYWQS